MVTERMMLKIADFVQVDGTGSVEEATKSRYRKCSRVLLDSL